MTRNINLVLILMTVALLQPLYAQFGQSKKEGQYFKASYLNGEASGTFKGWDQSGLELVTGQKSSNGEKSYWDFAFGTSLTGKDVSAGASGENWSASADVSTLFWGFTLYPSVGFDVTDWMSLYAGPHLGMNYGFISASGEVTVDGKSYSAGVFEDEVGYHYGYGAGVRFVLGDALGFDVGWRNSTHPDWLGLGHDYEADYWTFGLYLEF